MGDGPQRLDGGVITAPIQAGGNSFSDSTKAWATNIWEGYLIMVTDPRGRCEFAHVLGNSRDSGIILGAWQDNFPAGSKYEFIGVNIAHVLRGVFGGGLDIKLNLLAPIAKAAIFNNALPAADTDILAVAITPTNSPSWLRIYVTIAVAGRLYLRRTVGGVTVSEDLNSGANLTANSAHCFGPIEWRTGDSLNLRYSATGANILVLRIDEIGAAE